MGEKDRILREKSIIKAWQAQKGQNIEIGVITLISDKMIELLDDEMLLSMEKLIASAIANKLIEDSLIPQKLTFEKERDSCMRCDELMTIVDGALNPTLLPLAMKMDRLLRLSLSLMKMKRISKVRKEKWLDQLRAITGERYYDLRI